MRAAPADLGTTMAILMALAELNGAGTLIHVLMYVKALAFIFDLSHLLCFKYVIILNYV